MFKEFSWCSRCQMDTQHTEVRVVYDVKHDIIIKKCVQCGHEQEMVE